MLDTVRRNVVELFIKTQQELLVSPQETLDKSPVDDLPVCGDGVEVEVVVDVVRRPPDAPYDVAVLSIGGLRLGGTNLLNDQVESFQF